MCKKMAKMYLPISLITPLKLKEILNAVRNTVRKTNPDYDLVIKRLHDMKPVTFGIDSDRNLISISSIHTAIHTATANIILGRVSASSNHRSKHTSTLLHMTTGR